MSLPSTLRLTKRPASQTAHSLIVRADATPSAKPAKVVKSAPSSPQLASGKGGIHSIEPAYWDSAAEANTWYPAPPPSKQAGKALSSLKGAASPHVHSEEDKKPTYGSKVISHSKTPKTGPSTEAYWKAATKNAYSEGLDDEPASKEN